VGSGEASRNRYGRHLARQFLRSDHFLRQTCASPTQRFGNCSAQNSQVCQSLPHGTIDSGRTFRGGARGAAVRNHAPERPCYFIMFSSQCLYPDRALGLLAIAPHVRRNAFVARESPPGNTLQYPL
jgi:hypothetical protein